MIKKSFEIVEEYEKKGVPVKKLLKTVIQPQEDGKTEVTIPESTNTLSTALITNIYDRAVAEVYLERQKLPNQAIRSHIEQALTKDNPQAPYSLILKQSRDLAHLIDWAQDGNVEEGKNLFDKSQQKVIAALGKPIITDSSSLLPTIATIVASSDRVADDLKEENNPVKTLMTAYHGIPHNNSPLDITKSIDVIAYIEAIDDETAIANVEKIAEKKAAVKKQIVETTAALTAAAELKINNVGTHYSKIVPQNMNQRRVVTAWLYQGTGSTIVQQNDIATFYKRAAQNSQLAINLPDYKTLN